MEELVMEAFCTLAVSAKRLVAVALVMVDERMIAEVALTASIVEEATATNPAERVPEKLASLALIPSLRLTLLRTAVSPGLFSSPAPYPTY